MALTRRQILQGAGIAVLAAGVPSPAEACSREMNSPFSARFWRRTWQERFSWPRQSQDMLHALVKGILENSPEALGRVFAPDGYMFSPPTGFRQPGPGRLLRRAAAIQELGRFASFTRDRHYALQIITLHPGQYIIIATLQGSGFSQTAGAGLYAICGGYPDPFRTVKFCAQVDTDFGGSGRIERIVRL
ncbi:twin-arginine translocation signal domain-containing protein [Sphingomonas sp. ZT3P38]|uniref:twin-arginine translocation signal domain-containing protein n=1 Tax=Parasphingomonas zepuensis TaxID=3096161 RepID=UPI002FC73035